MYNTVKGASSIKFGVHTTTSPVAGAQYATVTKKILYRDGVGETMYDQVRTTELPQVRSAYTQVYPPGA